MKRLIILFILLVVAVGPMFRGLFFPYEMYLSLAIISGLCVLYFMLKIIKKEKLQLGYVIVYAGIGLLIAYCIAFVKAVNVRGNIETLMQYTVFYMIMIVILDYFHDKIDSIPWMTFMPVTVLGFFSAIVGLAGYTKVFPELDVTVNGQRIGSTLQYANTAAIYYLVLIVLAMGFVLNQKNIFVKGFFAAISNVMFFTLFFTSSRGVFLVVPVIVFLLLIFVMPNGYRFKTFLYVICVTVPVLTAMQGYEANSQINNIISAFKWIALSAGISAISVMFFSLLFRIKMGKIAGTVLGGLFLVGVGILLAMKWQTVYGYVLSVIPKNIIKRIGDINFSTNSVVIRFELYRDAIRLLKEHWLLGLGGGGFASLYQSVQEVYYAARLVHNHYLQVFVEAGIAGFFFFSFMVATACVYSIYARIRLKEPKHKVYLMACFCAFLSLAIHSVIDFNLSYTSISYLFFVLIGVSSAYFSFARNEKNSSEQESIKQTAGWKKVLIPTLMILICIPCIFLGVRYSQAAQYAALGAEYKDQIEVENALEQYEKAAKLDPLLAANHAEISDLSLWMANTAIMEEDKVAWVNKAISEGEEAIRLDRYYPYFNKIMTDIYLYAGEYVKAGEQAQMLVYVQPLVSKNYELLAKTHVEGAIVLVSDKQVDKAREWIKECLSLDQNPNVKVNYNMSFYLGKAALLSRQFEKASKLLEYAAKGPLELKIDSDRLIYIINEETGNTEKNEKYKNVLYMSRITTTPIYKQVKEIIKSGVLK